MDGLLERQLDEPEVLIYLVSQNLPEQADVRILLRVLLDAADDGPRPLDDKLLQSVSLIQISVHVLFHGLPGLLGLDTLLVVFLLLCVHIVYYVLKLLQRQLPGLQRLLLQMHYLITRLRFCGWDLLLE